MAVPDPVDARLLALVAEVGRVAVHDLAKRAGLDVREVAARLAALGAAGFPVVVGVEGDPAALRYALAAQGWPGGSGPHQVNQPSGPYGPVPTGPPSGPLPVYSVAPPVGASSASHGGPSGPHGPGAVPASHSGSGGPGEAPAAQGGSSGPYGPGGAPGSHGGSSGPHGPGGGSSGPHGPGGGAAGSQEQSGQSVGGSFGPGGQAAGGWYAPNQGSSSAPQPGGGSSSANSPQGGGGTGWTEPGASNGGTSGAGTPGVGGMGAAGFGPPGSAPGGTDGASGGSFGGAVVGQGSAGQGQGSQGPGGHGQSGPGYPGSGYVTPGQVGAGQGGGGQGGAGGQWAAGGVAGLDPLGTWGPPGSAAWARGDANAPGAARAGAARGGQAGVGTPGQGAGAPVKRTGAVGETLHTEGLEGERLAIQLVEVVDPADFLFTAAGYRLQPGERSVVVHTELTNRGSVPFSSLPDLYLVLLDEEGQSVAKAPVSLSSRPPHRIGVKPGETAGGHTVYVLPEATELTAVRWSPRPDDEQRTLTWSVRE